MEDEVIEPVGASEPVDLTELTELLQTVITNQNTEIIALQERNEILSESLTTLRSDLSLQSAYLDELRTYEAYNFCLLGFFFLGVVISKVLSVINGA